MGNIQAKRNIKRLKKQLYGLGLRGDNSHVVICGFSSEEDVFLPELLPLARGKSVRTVSITKSVISPNLLLLLNELELLECFRIEKPSGLNDKRRKILGRWLSELPSDRKIEIITESLEQELIFESLLQVTCPIMVLVPILHSLKLGKIIVFGKLCEINLYDINFSNKRQERSILKTFENASASIKVVKLNSHRAVATWNYWESSSNERTTIALEGMNARDVNKLFDLKMPESIESVDINSYVALKLWHTRRLATLLERSSLEGIEIYGRPVTINPAATLTSRVWRKFN